MCLILLIKSLYHFLGVFKENCYNLFMADKNRYCTIYVVRHGETEYNVKKILQGQTDSALTQLGEKQARERAESLKHIHFDAIFSSDMPRAQRTAEIIILDRQLAVTTSRLLRERAFGRFDGKPAQEFQEQNKMLLKKMDKLSESEKRGFKFYEGYETDTEIASRMITFLREVAVTYPGKIVLVVSHGAIIRALLVHLGYGSFDELPAGTVVHLAYVKLESDGVDFFIKETEGINKATL